LIQNIATAVWQAAVRPILEMISTSTTDQILQKLKDEKETIKKRQV
jgi:hypothetical protein